MLLSSKKTVTHDLTNLEEHERQAIMYGLAVIAGRDTIAPSDLLRVTAEAMLQEMEKADEPDPDASPLHNGPPDVRLLDLALAYALDTPAIHMNDKEKIGRLTRMHSQVLEVSREGTARVEEDLPPGKYETHVFDNGSAFDGICQAKVLRGKECRRGRRHPIHTRFIAQG